MIVINVLTQLGYVSPEPPWQFVFTVTIACALAFSWFIIEKSALKHKKASIHAV